MRELKIIDVHCHDHIRDKGWFERYLEDCQENNVTKACVCALGEQFSHSFGDNRRVIRLVQKYPKLVIGFGFVWLGKDKPDIVDRLYDHGFRGLKVINPLFDYDDRRFFGIYERAQKHKMPILFHTGWVSQYNDISYDVACKRMNPIFLDTIARYFPELTVVGAHFGGGIWSEIACKIVMRHPRLFFDLSGGTVCNKPYSFFRRLFAESTVTGLVSRREKINTAIFEKFVYGTDGARHKNSIMFYRNLMKRFNVSHEIQNKVFYENMAKALNLE